MMENTDLPQTFKRLHFLKLDSKSTSNSQLFKYNLNNHFGTVVAQIVGQVVVEGDTENEINSHIELVATEPPKNGRRQTEEQTTNVNNSLFRITIKRYQDNERSSSSGADKIDDNLETLLTCELLSDKEQVLGRINVMKDTRSSTYSYDVLDRDEKGGSLFQISRKQNTNENKCDVFINLPMPEGSPDTETPTTIARVNVEDNKISLSMTPELSPLTKLQLISIMLLMEVVENRQK